MSRVENDEELSVKSTAHRRPSTIKPLPFSIPNTVSNYAVVVIVASGVSTFTIQILFEGLWSGKFNEIKVLLLWEYLIFPNV